jgi:hypothetical protein
MAPRAGGRHCAECDRVVTNVSALTKREAIALYEARGGDLCGYVVHDGRGEPTFAPEPRAPLALGVLVAGALAACEPQAPPPIETSASASLAPPLPPLMRPMSDEPEPAAPEPDEIVLAAAEPIAIELASSGEPLIEQSPPTPEDRARERRKRAARRPRVPPHAAFAGIMMLDD